MKPNVTLMRLFVVLALAIVGAMAWSANTKQTVSQVSSSVSLTANVDYVISHSPCSEFLDLLYEMFTQCGEDVPYYLEKKIEHSVSS